MRLKHFQNKARRSYWSVHFEAWRRSGLSRAEYCRRHNLNECTFVRWLKALDVLEAVRNKAREWRKRTREPVCRNKQNKAVQAFWAMHVEALNWSGVSAKDCAAAHHISIYSLCTWRARLDEDPLRIDWRARLHPSVRAKISSNVSSAAKGDPAETVLTEVAKSDPPRDRRSNRRSFTDEEKLAIVLETEQPDVSVAAVCRRHDIATSMVFCWRIQFGFCEKERAKLAAVTLADGQTGASSTPLPCGIPAVDARSTGCCQLDA